MEYQKNEITVLYFLIDPFLGFVTTNEYEWNELYHTQYTTYILTHYASKYTDDTRYTTHIHIARTHTHTLEQNLETLNV